MDESILKIIKKMIGLDESYTQFDVDVILHINMAFATLNHLGVGPQNGFRISDDTATWDDYETDVTKAGLIKDYIYMKVKLLFDPPTSNSYSENLKESVKELEWRLFEMYDPRLPDEDEKEDDEDV